MYYSYEQKNALLCTFGMREGCCRWGEDKGVEWASFSSVASSPLLLAWLPGPLRVTASSHLASTHAALPSAERVRTPHFPQDLPPPNLYPCWVLPWATLSCPAQQVHVFLAWGACSEGSSFRKPWLERPHLPRALLLPPLGSLVSCPLSSLSQSSRCGCLACEGKVCS